MDAKSPTRAALTRLIPPLTVWAIGRILDLPAVKGSVMELDGRANKQRHEMARSVKRRVKNARSNIPWLAAGAAAIVVGIGLIAMAAREK
ncbi:MAG TPA: hypothetical protein VLC46_13575 [Thermoanaerobaculia bacterium]|jgi:hypothetical protein|nr:hypothetical protein [Thermoanaerobaculia bacterium]